MVIMQGNTTQGRYTSFIADYMKVIYTLSNPVRLIEFNRYFIRFSEHPLKTRDLWDVIQCCFFDLHIQFCK